ncbi:hypothetical protein KBX50_05100 [Micromonospora sp. C51]|uniref:hypothetical protein n=1 Tax=Micromonospora sp. C51 TaxID=2824879 RepID=UPI001B366E98|nr:hypothetical protein [Micromonospora sp. C51]MBQ1047835.1 hypothetical protein [Micromonospora sp. C51]
MDDAAASAQEPAEAKNSDGDRCPHCGSDQRGEQIPEEHLRAGWYGEWNGEPRHFSRTLLVEIRGVYDGGLFWACPDCDGRWHRWPPGSRLHAAAEPYVQRHQRPTTP